MHYRIVMGAAVRADGTPSGALRRRLESALGALPAASPTTFVVTGGRGETGYVEAEIMKEFLVRSGVPEARVLVEPVAASSLESVLRCAALLSKREDVDRVSVCSDRYHLPRCRWLLRLLGIASEPVPIPSGRRANGLPRWLYYYVREAIAIPVDTLLLFWRR